MNPLSRREFLKLSAYLSAVAALQACNAPVKALARTATPTAPPAEAQTFQTLRRITCWPRAEELARAAEIGLDAFIEEQLSPESIDDRELEDRLKEMTLLTRPASELFEKETRRQAAEQFLRATALRAVYSKRQLYELMVDFWSNHFNIYLRKNQQIVPLKIVDDREVIRPHALGNFRDLLFASMQSPAMLVYLDNALSQKELPNENYARELLELHTLGVDGGYTHHDIDEVARALTGWSVAGPRMDNPGEFIFRERAHDDGEKTILGQTFPAGQGIRDGEQLADLLANHPATAQHIAYKLARRFVSDQPPADLVSRAAETFSHTNGDIRAVMSVILHSQEFKDSLGTKFKRPFEFIVSALRATNAEAHPQRFSNAMLTQMGQPLFMQPTPDGYPDTADAWKTTNGLLARWNYALTLAFNATDDAQVDWQALAGSSFTPEEVLNQLNGHLLGGLLDEKAQQIILRFAADLNESLIQPAIGALLLASPAFQYR
ncbi:MAG: DUF1800 domain-containing protein [Anaerolineae bacterium]|nr:MAG: DUF1800 domain-containing protein [Anaerolineae bacterium]